MKKINTADFSESLGLIQVPVIRFSGNNENSEQETEKTSKLQKLKEKIKMKKLENRKNVKETQENEENAKNNSENINENSEEIEKIAKSLEKENKNKEKILKKRRRENSDVLSSKFEVLREKNEENDEGDEFLVLKTGEKTHEKHDKNVGFGISKRQLKKIKPDGHFSGKNKTFFDEKGDFYK